MYRRIVFAVNCEEALRLLLEALARVVPNPMGISVIPGRYGNDRNATVSCFVSDDELEKVTGMLASAGFNDEWKIDWDEELLKLQKEEEENG